MTIDVGNPFNITPRTTSEMRELAKDVRRDILTMTAAADSGHPGGALSSVEILVALYFNFLRHDPANPKWIERDRFIDSKGHIRFNFINRFGITPSAYLSLRQIKKHHSVHSHRF